MRGRSMVPGLGTFAFDDEGVPAQSTDIIRDGLFTGYMTSRETAAAVGEARSNGTMRADGWSRLPLIRMTNVSLLPGGQIARRGLRRRGSRHLHGDQPELVDRRQALQLPVRLRDRLGDPQRQARAHAEESQLQRHHARSSGTPARPSPDREHWTLWGTPNCGKGQPEQVMGTGHGASPARFRRIKIGGAYAD